ncbi:hypothetical protein ACFYWP_19320 [Actinacidiphila glaucinigra]|uniref:hypothetical protein n=1 Tax=Actinacidiphila glaucinigra TaxID=235986 RepID=UPI00369D4A68
MPRATAVRMISGVMNLLAPVHKARLERWVRTRFDPTDYGMVPVAMLDPRRAGPPLPAHRIEEMQAVADAAWEGDWRTAASYVDRAGEEWDERWHRLELLQEIAGQDDDWLGDWRRNDPDNGDAATLHAQLLVHRAWEIRGPGYAHQVPAERMRRFKQMLPAAMEAAQHAAGLAPRDPGPWVVMITTARALKYRGMRFHPLWEGLAERAPHHYSGHWQALQYWCAKWCGTDKQMMDFAERAVRNAPEGSPLAGIYLHALSELTERHGVVAPVTTARVKGVLTEVDRSLAQARGDARELPRLRHLLAHYLGENCDHEAALEQFRLIGPWCGAEPWTDKADPVAAFQLARGIAAAKAANGKLPDTGEGAARWGRTGG